MHIVLLPSWYATAANPVRGNFFRNEARALMHAGHRVGMIVPPSKFRTLHGLRETRANLKRSNQDVDVVNDEGIWVYRVPWWGWRASVSLEERGRLATAILDRYISEQGRPDVLHGQAILYGGYLAAYSGRQKAIPAVVTEHASVYLRGLILPGQPNAVRYTLSHASKILVVAPSLAQALSRYAPDRQSEIEVLGNVVDTGFFRPAERPLAKLSGETFTFAMVASLTPRKAHSHLLQAFADAFRGENVRLEIAGAGYSGKKLQVLLGQIDTLGIENQVEVRGMISQAALLELMQNCDALVSSSHVETFGVTLIEAMACGKPVVATRSGGPEFFVNERNGILVPPRDVPALARAMRRLVENYDQYDPIAIRAEVEARFSEQAIVERLNTIYREVVASTGT